MLVGLASRPPSFGIPGGNSCMYFPRLWLHLLILLWDSTINLDSAENPSFPSVHYEPACRIKIVENCSISFFGYWIYSFMLTLFHFDLQNRSQEWPPNYSFTFKWLMEYVMSNKMNQIAKYSDAIGLWMFLLNNTHFTNSEQNCKMKILNMHHSASLLPILTFH